MTKNQNFASGGLVSSPLNPVYSYSWPPLSKTKNPLYEKKETVPEKKFRTVMLESAIRGILFRHSEELTEQIKGVIATKKSLPAVKKQGKEDLELAVAINKVLNQSVFPILSQFLMEKLRTNSDDRE